MDNKNHTSSVSFELFLVDLCAPVVGGADDNGIAGTAEFPAKTVARGGYWEFGDEDNEDDVD